VTIYTTWDKMRDTSAFYGNLSSKTNIFKIGIVKTAGSSVIWRL